MPNLHAVLVGLILAPACASEPEEDAIEQAVVPFIDGALSCGTPATVGLLTPGTDLQRFDISLVDFPEARCNNGDAGVFFVRPAASPAGTNKWIIQLQGGGGCRSADDCAKRWCHVGTHFGMTQMASPPAGLVGIVGEGILYRGPAQVSPFEDANHVLIRYCSSDTWAGRTGPIQVTGVDPASPVGASVDYRIAFRGADILDAVIAILRRDGVAGISYTLGDGDVAMPDLDAASRVVFAGASAGGGGVINNGDRINAVLAANDLDGVLDFRLLIDSILPPNAEDLGWSNSPLCTNPPCDWEEIFLAHSTMYDRISDTSCDASHAATEQWLCDDTDHVIRHHVMTPMMVRMGLTDVTLSDNLVAAMVEDPAGNPMTVPLFAAMVRTELAALSQIAVAGQREETAPVAPALFGPNCPKHETLSTNSSTFNTRITQGGVTYRMFDVWANWVAGAGASQVVHAPGNGQVCL